MLPARLKPVATTVPSAFIPIVLYVPAPIATIPRHAGFEKVPQATGDRLIGGQQQMVDSPTLKFLSQTVVVKSQTSSAGCPDASRLGFAGANEPDPPQTRFGRIAELYRHHIMPLRQVLQQRDRRGLMQIGKDHDQRDCAIAY